MTTPLNQEVSHILAALREAAPELTTHALQAVAVRGWLDLGVCVVVVVLCIAGLWAVWKNMFPRFDDLAAGHIVCWVFTIIIGIILIIAGNSIPEALIRILEPEGVLILRIIGR